MKRAEAQSLGWVFEAGVCGMNNVLEGTTNADPPADTWGTVHLITLQGDETDLWSFTDISCPCSALTAVSGVLYGTAAANDVSRYGAIFAVTPQARYWKG